MEAAARVVRSVVFTVVMVMMGSSQAYDFYVGGRDGWVQNPSESYSQWAERNRFQVSDRLVFKYKTGEDSVLVVTKEDYATCNTSNPTERLDGGDSVFQFDRSGPFFFISGTAGRCQAGQKLVVVVLAVRHHNPAAPTEGPSSEPPSTPEPAPSKSGSAGGGASVWTSGLVAALGGGIFLLW